MDTIDLAATATRALKLLSGQGMSEKSLYGYTHTGFGCVVRHFQAKGLIDRKPENGGNGVGCQEDIAYTLTAADHHAVFSRQRVDMFTEDDVASTESARQHKDATDLVYQETNTEDTPRLIRRLTPLECERLQGLPRRLDKYPRCVGLRQI